MSDEWLDDPERVTPERVADDVREIQRAAADGKDQVAHDWEATLHLTVLAAISRGIIVGEVARRCAEEAMRTIDIEFSRWPS